MPGNVLFLWILAEVCAVALPAVVLFRSGIRTWMVIYGMFVLAPLSVAPFAYSPDNRQAVGGFFEAILGSLDRAVLLTLLGFALFAAGIVWAVLVRPPRVSTGLTARLFITWSRRVWTPFAFWSLIGLSIFLTLLLVAAGVPFGAGIAEAFSGRGLRPLMNVWQSVLSLSVPFCVCYALHRPRLLSLMAVLALCVASFYTGQRTVSLINIAIGAGAYFAFRNNGSLTLRGRLLVVGAAVALFASSAVVYQVRSGEGPNLFLAFTSVYGDFAYGNQFSDIRDFAWVLSGFDGRQLNGLTYLAGLISPFTSAELPLRAEYGLGRWTLWTAGVDTNAHGGLRMPFFAEIYLNFGVVGLVLLTPLLGYLAARLVKAARSYTTTFQRDPSGELLAAILLFAVRDVIFSSAMFRVYVVLAIVLAIYAASFAFRSIPARQVPTSE